MAHPTTTTAAEHRPLSSATSSQLTGQRRQRLRARFAALAVLLLAWQLVSIGLGASTVPPPGQLVAALLDLGSQSYFWAAIGATCVSTMIGLLAASLVAIPLGLLVGANRFLQASTRLPVDFLRTIPPVTLIPLAVLIYGPTTSMKVFLVVFGAFWPLFVQATYAVRETDPVVKDMVSAFRLPRSVTWRMITLPSSAPFLLTGLRVASTMALLLSVAGELIGNAPGIGREIALSQMNAQAAIAYAFVVVAALLGVGLNLITAAAQRRLLFWHPSFRGVR